MKKNGSRYYWCKMCGYNNTGCWVNTHKSDDCYRARKKSDEKSGEDKEEVEEENIALKMAECGFLAIL